MMQEIFDALRSIGEVAYFGFLVEEPTHTEPTVMLYAWTDFDRVLKLYEIEFNSESMRASRGRTCVGYAYASSLEDIKTVLYEEGGALQQQKGTGLPPEGVIAKRAGEIFERRQKSGQSGDATGDWNLAIQELMQEQISQK